MSKRALYIGAAVVLGAAAACSSSTTNNNIFIVGGGDGGADAADNGADGAATTGTCADTALSLLFNPMYSSFEPSHDYLVPVVATGADPARIVWQLSDTSIADVTPDTATGGIQLRVKKVGTTDVLAAAGGHCGKAALTVTAATTDQWALGSDRYNNGNGQTPACASCHGAAASGAFKDTTWTPEQAAGMSDSDLEATCRHGTIPPGGFFDPTIVPQSQFSGFHAWTFSDDESAGIRVYLRSLSPSSQGKPDFGGKGDAGG